MQPGKQPKKKILPTITSPKDIKKLTKQQLKQLAVEIRHRILEVVAKNGGHLGGPLGATELTLALHYVFNTPNDQIILDTGHQCYPHKLITGRNDRFDTLRQWDGICGFCNIFESEYDSFGAGHAATSISAALGMAKARDLHNSNEKVIAVIGDGSMTAGLAYEALNNAGYLNSNLLVILNDNRMSISPNVGALSKYLTKIRKAVAHPRYRTTRQKIADFLVRVPGVKRKHVADLYSLEGKLRNFNSEGAFFEALGFRYFGPINGHKFSELIPALQNLKDMKGPILLHVHTEKGKGYQFAEDDMDKLHGMSPFDVESGKKNPSRGNIAYTKAFSNALIQVAEKNQNIVGITAAMKSGTGLDAFEEHFPKRFFDVGIAEQHAVTFAAGMARRGLHPVVAIYSTFLQRSFDMIIHDVALQQLPVVFALDRAGLVGDDGPTHAGVFDIAYLRLIPNMVVMVPKDENELGHMVFTASTINGPTSIRYARGGGIGVEIDQRHKRLPVGKSQIVQRGRKILMIGVGPILYDAMDAAKELSITPTIINARFVKPLDVTRIVSQAKKHEVIITLEEGTVEGGFGSAVCEVLAEHGISVPVKRVGIPDRFIDHGKPAIQKNVAGIDKEGIKKVLKGLETSQ